MKTIRTRTYISRPHSGLSIVYLKHVVECEYVGLKVLKDILVKEGMRYRERKK